MSFSILRIKMWNKLSLLLIVSVQCLIVVLSASIYQRQYSGYLFTIPASNNYRSQTDAQTWCSQNGSTLLSITDLSIQNAVVAFMKEAYRQNQLTGNNIITDGKRQRGEWTWINQTTKTSLAFQGQDGDIGKSYAYLYAASSGFALFADKPTEGKNYYICEGSIFSGYGFVLQGLYFQSFGSDTETVSWFEARNRCLLSGGDLATFEFISTNEGLSVLNDSVIIPSRKYWIGARREWWTWQRIKSDITYSQWSVGHPIYDANQNCICLLPNNPTFDWKLGECQCNWNQFVCISPIATTLPSTSRISLPSTSLLSTKTSNHFNFQSSSHSNTISTQRTTEGAPSISSSVSGGAEPNGLAIGLGVGIGGGVLLIAIVVIIFFLLSRKGYSINSFRRKQKTPEVETQPLPDVTTVYADIAKVIENEAVTSYAKQQQSLPPPSQIEYASLEIVTDRTNSSPESDITITNLNRGTLAPPHSRTFLVLDEVDGGGQEYGQITKTQNKGK